MKYLYIVVFICITHCILAQFAFVHNDHSLEISGLATLTFTNRDNISIPNKHLKYFDPRNAQLKFEYNYKIVKCVLQADIAAIALANTDPENIGLMNLYIQIKPISDFKIRAGFFKVRYSRSNLVSEFDSPFFNRAEICRGQIFGSRDFGLNINKSLMRGLLNINLGMYTGIAETSLKGKNDLNTNFEYVARVEFAWPQKDKETDFDFYKSYLPQFTIGTNARYTNKDNTIPDTYQLLVIGGKKITQGYDAGFFYKGLGIQAEYNYIRIYPLQTERLMGSAKPYFNVGGYYIQSSYYNDQSKIYLAIRYDRINQNDNYIGYGDRITASAGSFFLHKHLQAKLNYTRILSTEDINTYNPPSWKNQFRIGIYYNL